MMFVQILCIGLCLIKASQQRELWGESVFEISALPLNEEESRNNTQITQEQVQNNTHIQVTGLSDTLYRSTFSQLSNITELRIVENQIEEIQSGALCSIPNLKILELDLNGNINPPVLQKSMFDNCNLDELILKFDRNISLSSPISIEQDALINIPNLKKLLISSLVVKHLKKDFLKLNSSSLTTLELSNIYCTKIDSDFLDDYPNLEVLEITHNSELVHLPTGLFKNTPKLEKLNLDDNAIKDLTWDEFEGLSSLKDLDVSDNQIKNFDTEKMATLMPKLEIFELDFNPLSCIEVKNITGELEAYLNRSIEVPNMSFFYSDC